MYENLLSKNQIEKIYRNLKILKTQKRIVEPIGSDSSKMSFLVNFESNLSQFLVENTFRIGVFSNESGY